MCDVEPQLSFREALVAAFIIESEIASVNHAISLSLLQKFIDDCEPAMDIAN